jgi:hypothetical protein
MIPLIDVETLATWVVTLIAEAVAIVRAAGEAVVTCGHEVTYGTLEGQDMPLRKRSPKRGRLVDRS